MNLLGGLLLALASLATICLLVSSAPRKSLTTRQIARYGVYAALAIALGIVESFLPDFLLPGMKIGFANLAILVVLYAEGFLPALVISLVRVALIGMLRGNLLSMGGWMSFGGAFAAILAMLAIKALLKKASPISVSLAGAVAHVIAQMGICLIYIRNVELLLYLPLLLVSATVSGLFIGFIALRIIKILGAKPKPSL